MNKREEGYNQSDTGNWNVASDYSRIKIMKPLDYCDHYENIARFGYDTLIEQLEHYGVPLDTLKLIGFERLINELLKICGNVEFAMKVGGTPGKLTEIKKKLTDVRSIMPVLSKTIKKKKKQILILNQNHKSHLENQLIYHIHLFRNYLFDENAFCVDSLNINHCHSSSSPTSAPLFI